MRALEIRKIVLEQSKRTHVGHIGSALSIADILACLYGGVLQVKAPADPERDRFILSKGHAALALYAALFLKGWIDEKTLNSFHCDGTLLSVHPEHALPGIDFSTGSLGHGLSFGVGAALAARMQGSSRRIFVLISDAECNEGSTWEAVMFAAHHRLSNLTAIIDLNGQQALGYTKDVMSLPEMVNRWISFGWDAREVDGHDGVALQEALGEPNRISTAMQRNGPQKAAGPLAKAFGVSEPPSGRSGDRPSLVVARTVFGKGVSFMENQIKWHYLPMSDEEYRRAMQEIESTDATRVC
jgi:transketolase